VYPGAPDDDYDGVDSDCAGDEDLDPDADGDGHRVTAAGGDDCDDTDADVHPDAFDACGSGVDEDCDGVAPGCRPGVEQSLSTAAARIAASGGVSSAGAALAGGLDLTGDGWPDVVVGAPEDAAGAEQAGSVWVMAGPLTGEVPLSDRAAVIDGEEEGLRFGGSLAVGDADGDGYGDLLVGGGCENSLDGGAGLPCEAHLGGVALAWFGPLSGVMGLADADLQVDGATRSDYLGSPVGGGGDLTGDGLPDWVLPSDLFDPDGLNSGGAVWMIAGTSAGVLGVESADAAIYGTCLDGGFGTAVAVPGDTDGDGMDDLVVTSYQWDTDDIENTGGIFLFQGPLEGDLLDVDADRVVVGTGHKFGLGWQVGAAGDQDSDGLDDVIVMRAGDDEGTRRGVLYLLHGPLSQSTTSGASAVVLGANLEDQVGHAGVHLVGDLDGDDHPDLLATSMFAESTSVLYGPLSGTVDVADVSTEYLAVEAGAKTGAAASPAGDMNADGYPDFLVGAPAAACGGGSGVAYLILGGGM
jgi:hypothetical protein